LFFSTLLTQPDRYDGNRRLTASGFFIPGCSRLPRAEFRACARPKKSLTSLPYLD
jgi:hypothetical protein